MCSNDGHEMVKKICYKKSQNKEEIKNKKNVSQSLPLCHWARHFTCTASYECEQMSGGGSRGKSMLCLLLNIFSVTVFNDTVRNSHMQIPEIKPIVNNSVDV